MNKNSRAIILLCSDLASEFNTKPFKPVEWGKLAKQMMSHNLEPYQVIEMTDEELKFKLDLDDKTIARIRKLLSMEKVMYLKVKTLKNYGIGIITRADKEYPKKLKQKLQSNCPPLFYYIGNLELLNKKAVGMIGTHDINAAERDFIRSTLVKLDPEKYVIVTGGENGTDKVVFDKASYKGYNIIEFVADSLIKRIKKIDIKSRIEWGTLLMMSIANPYEDFNIGTLMGNNKYIFSQTELTLIVSSGLEEGSVWYGTLEAKKKNLCNIYCNENTKRGSMALIKKGFKMVDIIWDAEVPEFNFKPTIKEELSSYTNF